MAGIERRAFGAGLHRSVETVVWVSSKLPLLSCSVVLQEFLPPGAYVDPEQLASLQ
ncbi:Glycosylphosphatidylinositol-mannosyltransferase I PIG-X/PBN1, partial [Trinorchestia longiramus]